VPYFLADGCTHSMHFPRACTLKRPVQQASPVVSEEQKFIIDFRHQRHKGVAIKILLLSSNESLVLSASRSLSLKVSSSFSNLTVETGSSFSGSL